MRDAKGQRKRRDEKWKSALELASVSEQKASKLRKFNLENAGRPPLEDTLPDLHNAIMELVTASPGADGRKRTEVLNSC